MRDGGGQHHLKSPHRRDAEKNAEPDAGRERAGMIAVMQDHDSEALVSRLSLQAVGYDDAVALGRQFLEAVEVTK